MYTYLNNCGATNGINVLSKNCAYILSHLWDGYKTGHDLFFHFSSILDVEHFITHPRPEVFPWTLTDCLSCIRLAVKKRPPGGSSSASSRGVCSAENGSSRQPACVSSAMSAEMIPKARRTSFRPSLLTHIRSGGWNPDRNACSSHNKPHKQINVPLSVDVANSSYSRLSMVFWRKLRLHR